MTATLLENTFFSAPPQKKIFLSFFLAVRNHLYKLERRREENGWRRLKASEATILMLLLGLGRNPIGITI
jgi:hypothetical protein